MLQFSNIVWLLSYSVWDVFNNFLLIDATDKRLVAVKRLIFRHKSIQPFHYSRTLPLKVLNADNSCSWNAHVILVQKSYYWKCHFQNCKHWYLIHTWSDKACKGFRCKGIEFLKQTLIFLSLYLCIWLSETLDISNYESF